MKAHLVPFTITSIELTDPLAPVTTDGRQYVLALARWQGRPIGWVSLHSAEGEIGVADLESEVTRQLEWPLIQHGLAQENRAIPVNPPISVVVCTRNRPVLLERCLAGISALEYAEYEVIVIDNAPADDATRAVVEGFPARYVREDRPGLDWARNRGVAEARYDIIAFTDDDAVVDPAWLTGFAAAFANPAVMAVTGLVTPMEMDAPSQVLFEHVYGGMGKGFTGRLFHRDQMRPSQLIAIYSVGVGANMAFRRTVFDQLGGFDTALDVGTPASGAGDLDMFHRVVAAGMPLWYEPRALVWHQHRREMAELKRQLFNDGRSFGVYLLKLWRTRTVPRRSLARYATWQWGRWLVGRVAVGMLGRHRMPLPLLWAGLKGALTSPRAYAATYRSDRLLRQRPASDSPSSPPPPADAVTVIIPAFNAAETLAECLDSIINQTHDQWEIVVVDDGSTDDTVALAERYAARDRRITVLRQSHGGVSAARNLGLRAGRYPWVLFLDADDWVLPRHLELMTAALAADPSLDAVHCGWSIAMTSGEVIEEDRCHPTGDLFHLLARHPAFIVHACVVRRAVVQSVGGFDPAYSRIQDWVMWQRVARTGCCFGTVPEVLAAYRMQAGSVSSEPAEVLDQGLQAIALGHGADPAVPTAAPQHAKGRPASELPEAQLAFLGWPAGILLARGADARMLLDKLTPYPWPDLAAWLGEIIYSTAPRALGRPRSVWSQIWPRVEGNVDSFLMAVEAHASAPGLSRSVRHDLARRVLQDSKQPFPLTVALTHGVRVEVTAPVLDIRPPAGAERLWCSVEWKGERVGTLELPICAETVPAVVLKDAIADRFAWQILERFFAATVYPEQESAEALSALHDGAGWDTLLRESWEESESAETPHPENGRVAIEISAPIPSLRHLGAEASIEVLVGGVAAGVFRFPPESLLTAKSTRSALNDALGYELCRAVVREAIIGRQPDSRGLRDRLRMEAAEPASRLDPGSPRLPREWSQLIGPAGKVTILGRHPDLPVGGSGSRRSLLPGESLPALARSASIGGQLMIPKETEIPAFAAYIPELISQPIPQYSPSGPTSAPLADIRRYDRHHFEASFARTTDPWSYASEYESIKYDQTMEMIPGGQISRALELGCAEGHFTVRLAPRVGHLIAADIADLALKRAAQRCRQLSNIEYRRLDLVSDPLPEQNDLVVCSEVLYYAGSEPQLEQVAARIAAAIKPGGHFITAHANVVADKPSHTGFAWDVPYGAATISRVFGRVPSLHLVRELKTPLYRIQLYRSLARQGEIVAAPRVEEEANQALPAPAIARWIHWESGDAPRPSVLTANAVTSRLPILMYHQVADSGSPARARWRVTRQQFELQLRYLRDAGFYSVGPDAWRAAMGTRQGLPGRAVLITFDDGYLDFADQAWPLLRQYGFSALMFVISGRAGRSSDWDPPAASGDKLLDWDQLRRLVGEGLTVGSHSATHRRLTGLTNADIVREAATSKSVIEQELGRPVSAFAYPYGDQDSVVQHLVGACGYDLGFGCRPGRAHLIGSLMDQPRIEVCGDDTLGAFIAKLEE